MDTYSNSTPLLPDSLVTPLRGLLLGAVLLALAGCAGMEPYDWRNHREEGPSSGAFSGPKGEFVIFLRNEPDEAGRAGSGDSKQLPDEDPQDR